MNTATEHARRHNRPHDGGSRRDTRGFERDSDTIRADMDRTLEALERKLSPRQIMDRGAAYLREHGSELVREVGDTVRHNPMPILLTAAGVVWLTAAIARARSEHEPYEMSGESEFGDVEPFEEASAYIEDEDRREDDDDTSLRSRAARARAAAGDLTHRASDKVHSTMHSARSGATRARSEFGHFVQEQPLVVGMLALAAGALVGAALPVSEYERQAKERYARTREGTAERQSTSQSASRQETSAPHPEYATSTSTLPGEPQ